MAGESARDYARRQREKAARHTRVAELYERGAAGERATAEALEVLSQQGWSVLHDIAWPGRPRANIDHVLIGPTGVFVVVDSKNWSGTITISGDVVRQNGRSRQKAIDGAVGAARAISQVLGNVPVKAVLCFTGDDVARGEVQTVGVCSTSQVRDLLTSGPLKLHAEGVKRLAGQLRGALKEQAEMPAASAAHKTDRNSGDGPLLPNRPASTQRPNRKPRSRRRTRRKHRSPLPVLVVGLGLLSILIFGQSQIGPAIDVFVERWVGIATGSQVDN